MARSAVVLNADRAARLLRRQKLREQQAQMELAIANAARHRADAALVAAEIARREAEQSVEDQATGRWKATSGMLITAAALNALRQTELALNDLVVQAERDVVQAQDHVQACGRTINLVNTRLAAETMQTFRRERFAAIFRNQLLKRQARLEEIVLEDDLMAREGQTA